MAAVEGTGDRWAAEPEPPGSVAQRIPLGWREVEIPPLRIGLFAPVDPDALLDDLTQEEFDRVDQRMPYWALLWPSAYAAAFAVASGGSLAGRRVLDLGCGLGLEGLAALHKGAHVTFLDWERDATIVAVASAHARGFTACEAVVADWRAPPPLAPFDLVLAADVLYEERNAPGVLAFLARHVAPGGEAWVTDPGRRHAEGFETRLASAGLVLAATERFPALGEAKSLVLWRLARAGG